MSGITYFFVNKIRIISIYFLWLLNIKFKCENIIENPKKIYNSDGSNFYIPNKIWIYWDSRDMPSIVKLCIEKIKRNNPNYDVVLLNNLNCHNFVLGLDNYCFPTIQHKSDYIRLYLLKEYGGVWMDASILNFKSIDFLVKETLHHKAGFFAFFNEMRTKNCKFPIIENWFLISIKNHPFVVDWFNEYIYALSISPEKYIGEINDVDYFHKICKEESIYLFNYLCAQTVLRKYNGDYLFWSCDDTAFFYHLTGSWRYMFFKVKTFHYTNIIKTLTLYKKPEKLPLMIKLVEGDRYHLNQVLEKKRYREDSLFDIFLKL